MTDSTLRTGIDAYVRQNRPKSNFGSVSKLYVNGDSGNFRYAFIYFGRSFPLNANIVSATLKIYRNGSWGGTNNLTVKRVTARWKESTITWNNKPSVTATNAGTGSGSGSDGGIIEIDVTDIMADVAAGGAFFGFRIENSNTNNRALYSSEASNGNKHPILVVEWTEAPLAPTDLVPSDGRAVSVSKPTIHWTFQDTFGDTTQASSQVQIDGTDDFASPVYDTGKVANLESSWDTGIVGAVQDWSGIDDCETLYWRVRVWDGTDLESDWSDAAEFTRIEQGTIDIINPPAPASNQVEEVTPPIDWTFTPGGDSGCEGGDQVAYQLKLYDVTDGDPKLLWDSGKQVSTDTSVDLPAGFLTSDLLTYRIDVYTWDDSTVDPGRAATPGDPPYVYETREFTYVPADEASPPTDLTASDDNTPVITFGWNRSSEPDYFAFLVDGVIVEPRLEPADLIDSGDHYTFIWYRAIPREQHTYAVQAVVDDGGVLKHSVSATIDWTTHPVGIWLLDEDDSDLLVFIAGKDDAQITIGEQGTLYTPVGRRDPVRILDTIRGYEGTVTGVLVNDPDFEVAGLSAKEWRDNLLTLKGLSSARVRLVIGDLNIPITMLETAVPPTPAPEDQAYAVSVAFVQTGEFTFDVVP